MCKKTSIDNADVTDLRYVCADAACGGVRPTVSDDTHITDVVWLVHQQTQLLNCEFYHPGTPSLLTPAGTEGCLLGSAAATGVC